MSFFDNVFSSQPKDGALNWKELSTVEQLDQAIERSREVPVAIFKHSVRCGISAISKRS